MSKTKSNPIIYEINRIEVPKDAVVVHIDASFKNGVGSYAFLVKTEEGLYLESDTVPNEWLAESSRSCELYSAVRALQYCTNKGHKKIGLYFDYVGIYSMQVFRPGDSEIFKTYSDRMFHLSRLMDIYFHKVESQDDFHSLVDLVSRLNVRLRLGDEELGRYRQLLQKGV